MCYDEDIIIVTGEAEEQELLVIKNNSHTFGIKIISSTKYKVDKGTK